MRGVLADTGIKRIHDAGTPADVLTEQRLYPSSALHGRVAHDIGRGIVSGRIAEGDLLPREAELSESYGVSRQAIREGLKVLAAKGLVVSRRRAGTRVAPRDHWHLLDPDVLAWHDPADLSRLFAADLVELRELIEPAAAVFAARRGTPERVAAIGAALESLRRGIDDLHAWSIADVAFHKAIFAASGNTLIERLSTILEPLLRPSFELQVEVGGGLELAYDKHRIVYEAIVARDPYLARGTMESILIIARNEVAMASQAERDGAAAPPPD